MSWRPSILGIILPLALLLGASAHAQQPPPPAAPQLTRPPQVLETAQAEYPPDALAARVQGEVQLWVDLDEHGEITRLEVAQSPARDLTEAAELALLHMRFSPAEVDNQPAAVRIAYTYTFKLPAQTLPENPAVVQGQVVLETGKPVALATVRAEPGTLLARTDQEGRYILRLPRTGTYQLYVSGPGIDSTHVELAARMDETITMKVTVRMASAVAPSYQTTVRTKAPSFEISRQQLSRDELRAVPGAFGDPLRVLEALPGLGRSPFASGILVMRGSSPDDSAVYLDGHPIPLLYHFGGGPSIIPPEALANIALEPGAFPVRYGRATAGLVEIETRPGHNDSFHGGAHVSVLDAGATLDGPIANRGSFRIAARRSYIDVILPLVTRVIGASNSLTLVPRYWDYFARADVDLTESIKFTLSLHGSDDVLSFDAAQPPFSLPSTFQLHTNLQRINPRLSFDLSDVVTLDVSPIISWLINDGETPTDFSDLHTFTVGVRTELQHHLGPNRRFSIGVDMVHDNNEFVTQLPATVASRTFPGTRGGPVSAVVNTNGVLPILQTGVYAEGLFRIESLRLSPGARLEHAEFANHALTTADPRLSARFELTPDIQLKAATGIYHRLPLANQVSPLTGNPDLLYERDIQSEIGLEWSFDTAHSLDIQGYYKHLDNLTISTGAVQPTFNGGYPLRFSNSGQGQSTGLEVLLKRKMSHGVMGWISYSLSLSQRRNNADQDWSVYVRDQTHNLNVLVSWELPWRFRVGGRFRYVTGYPTQNIVGAVFDADSGGYTPKSSSALARLPPFIQLDLRADKEFGDPNVFTILVFIDVQNVTNRQNAEYYSYSTDYSQRYAYPGLPILPSVGVEARF